MGTAEPAEPGLARPHPVPRQAMEGREVMVVCAETAGRVEPVEEAQMGPQGFRVRLRGNLAATGLPVVWAGAAVRVAEGG